MEKWINQNTDNGFKNDISSLFLILSDLPNQLFLHIHVYTQKLFLIWLIYLLSDKIQFSS